MKFSCKSLTSQQTINIHIKDNKKA